MYNESYLSASTLKNNCIKLKLTTSTNWHVVIMWIQLIERHYSKSIVQLKNVVSSFKLFVMFKLFGEMWW